MDVAEERFAAKRVIERLQEQFAYYGHIEKVLSEEKPLPATETPQKNIPAPSDTDIVVVLLWSRLGTPILDEQYRERPGDPPMTGTEWEFYDAARSYQTTGRPFLLVYRKMAKVLVDLDDEAELERRQEQKRMLEQFERRWFRGTEGAWKGYYHPFATTAELETLLEQHLGEQLRSELADESAAPVGALALVRLAHLADVNRRLGRERTDTLIKATADVLRDAAAAERDHFLARLNGAEP